MTSCARSRKQRAASAVGEGSIAFELVHHTWIDFDYHRTNDGQRGVMTLLRKIPLFANLKGLMTNR